MEQKVVEQQKQIDNQIKQNSDVLKLQQKIQVGKERLWTITWHPSGEYFATAGGDKIIRIWGKQSNESNEFIQLQTIDDVHEKSIRSLCFSPDGQMLASGSFDSQIGIYKLDSETKEYELITKLEGHDNEIKSVNWSSDSKFLLSCSRDKTIWVWDYDEDLDFSCYSVLDGHSQDVKMAKFVPQTFDIASCSFDDTIRYWEQDDEEWETKAVLSDHKSIVWSVDFSQDGSRMASVSEDGQIKIWLKNEDTSSKFPYIVDQNMDNHHNQRPIYSCSFSNDGMHLLTVGGDNSMCLFQKDLESDDSKLRLIKKYENAHIMDINCVQFNPKQDIAVTVGDDKCIKIWQIQPENM